MNTKENLYTILLEYEEGTYIRQVYSDNEKKACIIWAENLDISKIPNFGEKSKIELISGLNNNENTLCLLSDLKNVWFTSIVISNKLCMIYIILTK